MALPVLTLLVGGGAYASLVLNSSDQGSVDLDAGLVGWWRFDGNADDSSPSGNDGTVHSATLSAGHGGDPDSAYTFAGTTASYIGAGTDSSLSFTGDFSLSAWINPTSYHTTGYFGLKNEFIARGTASTYNYALQATDATTISFIKRTGAESLQFYNFTGIPSLTNNWTLVTATRSGNTLTLYINGEPFSTKTVTNVGPGVSDPMYLGTHPGNVEQAFTGAVDDVRIYNRTLNGQEARALYTEHSSQLNVASGEKGLVGRWRLDGNAKDSTPYANNGTINGATLTTDRQGSSNSAYNFNGTSNSISVANNSHLTFGSSDNFSVSAWIKPTSPMSLYEAFVEKGGQDNNVAGYQLFTNNNDTVYFRLTWPGGPTYGFNMSRNGLTLDDGSWHFVTGVVDRTNNTAYLYVDDRTPVSANISTVGNTSSTTTLFLGRGGAGWFKGALDDVRIYNRALSSNDISNMYSSYDSQVNLYRPAGSGGGGADIISSLTAQWNFTGNAKDYTPYSNNGTVNGATLTADRFGNSNRAYNFNGSTYYINVANSASLNPTTAYTVSAWVKPNSTAGGSTNYNVIAKEDWGNFLGYRMYLGGFGGNNSSFSCTQGNGSTRNILNSGVHVTDTNHWYHLVCTYDSGNMSTYVDGSFVNSLTGGVSSISNTATSLGIGRYSAGGEYCDCKIDDVRIYKRALSLTDVQALYNLAE